MADINAELLRFNNRIGPQYLDRDDKSGGLDGTMKPTEGSDGALHTKIVDHNGNPISSENKLQVTDIDVKAELEAIKAQQAQILQRLDQPIDTQLTGSIVELVDFERSQTVSFGSTFELLPLSVREEFSIIRLGIRTSSVTNFDVVLEATGVSGNLIANQVIEYSADNMVNVAFDVYTSRYRAFLRNTSPSDITIRRFNVIGVM